MIDDTNLFCRKTEKENSHFRRGFPFHILLEADIILLRFLCIWTFIFLRNKQEHLISQDQRFNIVLQNLSYCLSGLRSLLCAFSDWNTTLPLEPFLEPSKEIRRRMLGEISNLKNSFLLFGVNHLNPKICTAKISVPKFFSWSSRGEIPVQPSCHSCSSTQPESPPNN